MIECITLQAAMRESYARALALRARGGRGDAVLVDETLAHVLAPLAMALEGDGGLVRAFRQVLDLAQPLSIDALVADFWPLASVRIATAYQLPAIATLTTREEIDECINEAIRIGAPTYNNGDARACATVYWATALCLTSAPAPRGIAGLARVLRPLRQAVDEPMAPIGNNAAALEAFAWRMRHALDSALDALR